MPTTLRFRFARAALFLAVLGGLACSQSPRLEEVGGGLEPAPVTYADGGCHGETPGALPCDVAAVLRDRCQRCHDDASVTEVCVANHTCFGTPFPLKALSDAHECYGARPRYLRMAEVIESGYMPFSAGCAEQCSGEECADCLEPPVEPLSAEQKATLLDWFAAGAPAGKGEGEGEAEAEGEAPCLPP